MGIPELRSSIPATRNVVYLNTGFTGPSPRPVIEAISDLLEREAAVGPASVEGLRLRTEANTAAHAAAAELLHVDPDEIILTHGTTEGVHVVLHGYDWQPGDELVTCDLEHPAIGTPVSVLEERKGVVVKRIAIPADSTAADSLRLINEAITPRTRVVALSHIQFSCGLKLPVKAIAEAAHAVGALFLVDGAQTGGAIDVNARELGADFYSFSGQKWLLGPGGTGAMYVRREHFRVLHPMFTTHALSDRAGSNNPEAVGAGNPLARYRIASQSSALVAGFAAAARLLLDIGMPAVEAHSMMLADRLRAGAREMPGVQLTGPTDPDVSCGLVSLSVAGWEPRQLVEELWERWRIAGRSVNHPQAVRFSCAVFNTADEIDQVLSALKTLVAEAPPVPLATTS